MAKAKAQVVADEKVVPISSVENRIIDGAYRCFAKFGIAKTAIEDIAREANLSRPTIYKYFRNKNDIVNQISVLEALKLNNEVRRRCTRQDSVVETIVEATLVAARVSSRNMYVRKVMESIYVPSMANDPAGPIHQINRGWWRRVIEEGLEKGELATDLSLDQMVSWLSLSQALLLVKIEAVKVSDEDLKAFIRRFIVDPLLAGHEAMCGAGPASASKTRRTAARAAPAKS